jgi:hypothetical protein
MIPFPFPLKTRDSPLLKVLSLPSPALHLWPSIRPDCLSFRSNERNVQVNHCISSGILIYPFMEDDRFEPLKVYINLDISMEIHFHVSP